MLVSQKLMQSLPRGMRLLGWLLGLPGGSYRHIHDPLSTVLDPYMDQWVPANELSKREHLKMPDGAGSAA